MILQTLGHASLLLKSTQGKPYIITDPWITGSTYWRSWWLQNYPDKTQLNSITDIPYAYITHEHPDHFSIAFYKKYSKLFPASLKILFQKTRDNRLVSFIKKMFGLNTIIFSDGITKTFGENKLTIIKNGHIDSGFVLETRDLFHININDCDYSEYELRRIKRLIKRKSKEKILYIQFSYASFRPDEDWLKTSAQQKLDTIFDICKFLKIDV